MYSAVTRHLGAVCKHMTSIDVPHYPEKTLGSSEVFKGAILRLRLDEAEMPNGKKASREVVEHPGGAAVMAELPNGKLLLIRQFRYPLGHDLYEFPAGKLDPGESPLSSIQRELEEETGYTASDWQELTTIYTSPGFCNERISLYRATGLKRSPNPRREEDEFIDVLEVTRDELRHMIQTRQVIDAKTICTLALVELLAG